MSTITTKKHDAGDITYIPEDIMAKLESAPVNTRQLAREKFPVIDAAIRKYYPQKSIRSIAKACGVADGTVRNRLAACGITE